MSDPTVIPVDLGLIAPILAPKDSKLRFRFGTVVSIESDRTCTVTVGGDTTHVSGVKYLAPPRPNAKVILVTDGLDLFALGHLAAEGGEIAPRANRSTTQSIADATDTAISFDAVNNDAWDCWSSGNAARLTAPVTGRYMAVGQASFAANGTGYRRVFIEKNGTSTLGRSDSPSAPAGTALWLNVTAQPFDMTKGDYIRLMVFQNSGGALNATSSSTVSPSLSLIYLGP